MERPRAAGVCQIVTHYRKYNRSEHVLRAHCVKHIQKTQYASFYIHCLCELHGARSSRHRNNKPKNNLINSFLIGLYRAPKQFQLKNPQQKGNYLLKSHIQ